MRSSIKILAFSLFCLSIWFVKIPIATYSFYAEDAMFYVEASSTPIYLNIFSPFAGYLHVPSRLMAEVTSLFSVEYASFVNIILVSFVFGLMMDSCYRNSNLILKSRFNRFVLSLGLPIVSTSFFDMVGSNCGLHFFLTFSLALILLNAVRTCKKRSLVDGLLIFAAILSDPLSVVIFVCFCLAFYKELIKSRFSGSVLFYSAATVLLLHLLVISASLWLGGRSISAGDFDLLNRVVKVSYLYLDRVVGQLFVPNWGFINSEMANDSAQLLKRASIAFAILISLGLVLRRHVAGLKLNKVVISNLYILNFLAITYWLLAGILFNPEPRYAIFPSLVLFLTFLFSLEPFKTYRIGRGLYPIGILLPISWIFFSPISTLRSDGPTWRDELSEARARCRDAGAIGTQPIEVLPKGRFYVDFSCASGDLAFRVIEH
jgi:hypothetical protein